VKVSQRYEQKPHQWNLAIMISLGGILWSALAFYVGTELHNHSVSETAHPAITSQLVEIRSDQLKAQILEMDRLICQQPENNYYRQELLNLITKWERLNSPRKFPTQLLQCANGH